MATVVSRLEAILTANTRDFDRGMASSETKIQKVGKTAGVAGLAIAGGLAYGLDKSVKAALAAQVSQARLEQAFKTSGLSAATYKSQVDALEASGRKLGFTDEQTKEALGSLLIATHSMTGASKDLSIAQDVARFKHVDLTAATKMLAMAMAGSQRATKQLGISIQPVTTNYDNLKATMGKTIDAHEKLQLASAKLIDKQATAALVIDTVKQKLGDQAAVYSKTASGAMEQFKAQLTFLEVSLGQALLPALTKVTAAAAKMTEWLSAHPKLVKVLIVALGALATALIAARTAQLLMNLAVLANPYVAAIAAIVAAGIAIYIFRDKLMNVFNWIKDHYPLLTGILAGPIGLAVAEIIKHRDALIRIFTNLPQQLASALDGAWHFVTDKFRELINKIPKLVRDLLGIKSPSSVFETIGVQIVHGMIKGLEKAGPALLHKAESLVSGLVPSLPAGGGKIGVTPGGYGSGMHASPSAAMGYAMQQLPKFGWGRDQFSALQSLWSGESGWRWNAKNSSSGAYGIPQSLPASKMGSAGPDWKDNAFTQIMWGLRYIAGRYGSPSAAYSAWSSRSPHWYASGGLVPGSGLGDSVPAMLTPGEMILNRSQQNILGGPGALARTFGFGPPRSGAFAGGGIAGGGTIVVPLNIDGNELARVMIDPIRRTAQVFSRRNGRRAF